MTLTKGAGHMLALGRDVWSWGMNKDGQLGRPTIELDYGSISPRSCKAKSAAAVILPEAVEAWASQSRPTQCSIEGASVRRVECGGEHTFVLTTHGELFAFGQGSHGQIGTEESHVERAAGESTSWLVE